MPFTSGVSTMAAACLLASSLAACGGCRDFAYSFGSGAKGESTPKAAVQKWSVSGQESPPGGVWSAGPAKASGEPTFVNGAWSVTVTQLPAGGWAVSAGSTCS